MCTVSVVHDYMRTNIPEQTWTRPLFNEYQEIIRRLTELDAKLNQPDCVDLTKAAWAQEVEARLQRLEQR